MKIPKIIFNAIRELQVVKLLHKANNAKSYGIGWFNLLASSKKSNHYQETFDKIDHRTNSYKARKEILL